MIKRRFDFTRGFMRALQGTYPRARERSAGNLCEQGRCRKRDEVEKRGEREGEQEMPSLGWYKRFINCSL